MNSPTPPASTANNSHRADFLLVLVTLLAAISWIFSKEAVLLMPALLFLSLRFFLAGLLLSLLGLRAFRKLTAEQLFQAVRVGLFFGAGMTCWIMGLRFGSHVGVGAFLTSLGVVLVPIFARLFFRETPPASTWAALPVAVLGLALLAMSGTDVEGAAQHSFDAGQLFYVGAACIFAIYFTLNMRAANHHARIDTQGNTVIRERIPATVLTAIVLLTVGCITGLLSFIFEPWRPTFSHFTGEIALWIALSAVVGSAARFLIQTYAQSLATNSHGVVIMVVEPVWTAILAAMWFGETMNGVQLAGCLFIFAALLISRGKALRQAMKAWLTR